MAKQKTEPDARPELTSLERLGLRVSAMINAPRAQLERCVTIHRLDTDTDEAWNGVMELLAEEPGIDMTHNDDGTVTLRWALESDGDARVEEGDDLVALDEASAAY
ncbi:DUF1654 domain-containing protein [Metapseudomonas otitidis]|uniref:DUF1654 domain-containing protein n=1 Tax=Metapseudomonas otitidis TaxID=319939 RepID=UPI002097E2D8|nr:DUF1654 domain-containing protein [Pseudomonas otitidis]MCO7555092.1 DUF1654 domain-containing protein [Pseudomonas otitidis]